LGILFFFIGYLALAFILVIQMQAEEAREYFKKKKLKEYGVNVHEEDENKKKEV